MLDHIHPTDAILTRVFNDDEDCLYFTQRASTASYDAGGRSRVSQLVTLGDYKLLNQDRTLLFDTIASGTSSFSDNKYNMSVTAGQYVIRQTKKFHPYLSGKSQLVECTFDNFGIQTGVVKRVGYFSSSAVAPYTAAYDGMYLENDGTTIRARMDRSGTSTLNVPITSWSGFDYLEEYQDLATWNNFTVIMFDFLWLGGAVMRLWVKTSKGFILAHVFHYAGTAQDTFTKSPNQPIRYEIRSSIGTGSFRYICAQVSTEGSIEEHGLSRAVTTGASAITLATATTKYPLIGVRKAAAYRDVAVQVMDISAFVSTVNDQALWTVELNPTLSTPLTYSGVANSSIEYGVGDGSKTVTSPGTIIACGYLTQNAVIPAGLLEHDFLSMLGSTVANVMDEIILCVTPITSSVGTFGTMKVKAL